MEYTAKGPVSPKALGYTETWEEAYELLTAYNMEKTGKIKTNAGVFIDRSPTFAEIYEEFYKEKFERDKSKTYSHATRNSTAQHLKTALPCMIHKLLNSNMTICRKWSMIVL